MWASGQMVDSNGLGNLELIKLVVYRPSGCCPFFLRPSMSLMQGSSYLQNTLWTHKASVSILQCKLRFVTMQEATNCMYTAEPRGMPDLAKQQK